jgi:hypothetical protein
MERRQDIALGAVFAALGLGAAWIASGYHGAGGTYPLVLGLILAALGLAVAGRAWRSASPGARVLIEAPGKFSTAVLAAATYVAAVVPLGFYTASLLLMLGLPAALGFRRPAYTLAVAAIFVGLVFLVFSVLLEKPLPREAVLSLGTGG